MSGDDEVPPLHVIGAHEAEDALPAHRDPASFPVPTGYGMSPAKPEPDFSRWREAGQAARQ